MKATCVLIAFALLALGCGSSGSGLDMPGMDTGGAGGGLAMAAPDGGGAGAMGTAGAGGAQARPSGDAGPAVVPDGGAAGVGGTAGAAATGGSGGSQTLPADDAGTGAPAMDGSQTPPVGDARWDSGGGGGTDAQKLWALMSGNYNVLAATGVTDGCMIGVDKPMAANGLIGVSIPVTVDNMTGAVSIGNSVGTPPMPSLGKGKIDANVAMLTGETTISVDAPSKCTFKRIVTGTLKMTADYQFMLMITRSDSNHMMCGEKDCTSTWTWTMGHK